MKPAESTPAKEPQTYLGLEPCGCLGAAVVNNPEHLEDVVKAVRKMFRKGMTVELVDTQTVRDMAWNCDEHPTDSEGA